MKSIAKALVGAAVAGLGALGVALVDGAVDPGEWVGVALATLSAFSGVYFTTNATVDTAKHSL